MKTPVVFSRGFLFCLVFSSFFLISGCATLAGSFNPQITADQIAKDTRLIKESIPTQNFVLVTYSRSDNVGQPLTIYVEGDGRAWLSKNHLSDDPTPIHPLVLELAALDPSPNVAYLARPCQYTRDVACDSSFWSSKRFSEEVIASMNEAVDRLKLESQAKEIHLVGYSGGAAVAVLIAAWRKDVASLRTVAGNLDPDALNQFHRVNPLEGSLDPMEVAGKLSRLPQRHFVGMEDQIIPPFIAQNFLKKVGGDCIQVIEYKGVTHYEGWKKQWPDILKLPVDCDE